MSERKKFLVRASYLQIYNEVPNPNPGTLLTDLRGDAGARQPLDVIGTERERARERERERESARARGRERERESPTSRSTTRFVQPQSEGGGERERCVFYLISI